MPYGRNKFIDPAGLRPTYSWAVNHAEEDQLGRERQITNTPTTGGVARVIQQGDEAPLVLGLSGSILHADQFRELREWFDLSRTQTIHFEDFAGDKYEVVITSFQPTRQRTALNPRDPSIPLHWWKYELRMQVVNVLAGSWLGTAA